MMEINAQTNIINSSIRPQPQGEAQSRPLNAFGIGPENQPAPDISPQARILQQNEVSQNERQASQEAPDETAQDETISGTDFVRVSSSIGSSARNNLTSEQATEVYRSIQDLL